MTACGGGAKLPIVGNEKPFNSGDVLTHPNAPIADLDARAEPDGLRVASAIGVAGAPPMMQVVDERSPLAAPPRGARAADDRPVPRGVTPREYQRRKAGATHNPAAPRRTDPRGELTPSRSTSQDTRNAAIVAGFGGQSDVHIPGTECDIGCVPPDHALAASSQWVVQGVNDNWAVFDTSGVEQRGWPKSAVTFFQIPSPQPTGCAPVPYTTDPRAFYDPVDGRFWAAVIESEKHPQNPACTFLSRIWVAVSQTGDPRGLWNVYAFDMSAGTQYFADFPGFGFDARAIYVSANMFDGNENFIYAKVFEANKAKMESGSTAFTPYTFKNLKATPPGATSSAAVDTVQPVQSQYPYTQKTEYLVNSFNLNFGSGECFRNCKGVVIWAFSDPIAHDSVGPNPLLSSVVVPSTVYAFPPEASQPGCLRCVETLDPRISAIPIAAKELIWGALNTSLCDSTGCVAGVFYFAVKPSLAAPSGCPLCTTLQSATLPQSGYFYLSGDTAAFDPVLMTNAAADTLLGFEAMSSSANPHIDFVPRAAADSGFGTMATIIQFGSVSATDDLPLIRWGDYEAASYDGVSGHPVWLGGETVTAAGEWNTWIGAVSLP
jgi:hypothetical protein